jgi:hypothetical protein
VMLIAVLAMSCSLHEVPLLPAFIMMESIETVLMGRVFMQVTTGMGPAC